MAQPIQRFEISDWQFKQAEKGSFLPATVPGTVHTDLLNNNQIEDPFYRTVEKDVQWIDKVDWIYETTFDVQPDFLNKEQLSLLFEGIDNFGDVYLNDSLILSTDNMFCQWEVPCKSLLRTEGNQLKVYLHSPIKKTLPLLEKLGYQLPASNDQSKNGGLGNKRVSIFARKAPYHFGWDWGPRLVTSGIWQPVYLQAWDQAKIKNIQIVQQALTDDIAKLKAVAEIESQTAGAFSFSIQHEDKTLGQNDIQVQEGVHSYELELAINQPKRWWTHNLGEPYLYELSCQIKQGDKLVDEKQERIGLRTIKLIQEPDERGTSFYFELNGIPIFSKGVNYIPNDNFLPRVDDSKYQHIIQSAVDANMNMIRVWGGGIYEKEIFYDLCDEKGVLVWQDFMFACSMYPGDEAFLANVKKEAIQNVKRLRNHPSIALWCGNNEIEVAWAPGLIFAGWGWKDRFLPATRKKIWADYEKIFHELLPGVLAEYDPDRPYWSSSPKAGPNQVATYDTQSGDVHYWGVWHGKEPFSAFKKRVGRFMSEYGFQAFPDWRTIQSYTTEEDWDIKSEVMAAHQRSGIGNLRIKSYMKDHYKKPKDFQSLMYMSQVLQAEGIKYAIEAHRRAMPHCMGSLYWQLNDCWPVASWSGIDYYGRWKAMHYFVKNAYESVLVSPTLDDKILGIYVVSDLLEAKTGKLQLMIKDFEGNLLKEETETVEIKANTSHKVLERNIKAWLKGINTKKVYLDVQLEYEDGSIARNTLYFLPVKKLKLPKSQVNFVVQEKEEALVVELSSPQLAKNLWLSIEQDGHFSDNYFDLFPGETTRVQYSGPLSKAELEKELTIKTVRDTY